MRIQQALRDLNLALGAFGWLTCAWIDQRIANKALVRGYLDDVLNRGNFTTSRDYFPRHGFELNGRLVTHDALPRLREALLRAFPDFHVTVFDQVAEGDKVVTRLTFTGTHLGEFQGVPPTGNKVSYSGIAVDTIEGGKVVRGWHSADHCRLFQQLGVARSEHHGRAVWRKL